MNDDQRLLANAALDGELTAEEQARADADPEVAAEVDRLATARDALRAVEPLGPGRRTSLLTVALDAFDGTRGTPTVVAPPPASLAARRRARWLLPAAAAALVGVAAVGAIVGSGGGDGDESAGDTVLEVRAEADDAATAEVAEQATAGADELDATFATAMSDSDTTRALPVLVRTPDELAAYAATVVTTGAETASAPATSDAAATLAVPAETAGGGELESIESTVPPFAEATAAGPSCSFDGDYLGTVSYGPDPATAVIAEVVRQGDLVLALAVEGCVELAVAPGP